MDRWRRAGDGAIARDSPGWTGQKQVLVSNLLVAVVGGGQPALLAGDGVGPFRRGCPMPHRYYWGGPHLDFRFLKCQCKRVSPIQWASQGLSLILLQRMITRYLTLLLHHRALLQVGGEVGGVEVDLRTPEVPSSLHDRTPLRARPPSPHHLPAAARERSTSTPQRHPAAFLATLAHALSCQTHHVFPLSMDLMPLKWKLQSRDTPPLWSKAATCLRGRGELPAGFFAH